MPNDTGRKFLFRLNTIDLTNKMIVRNSNSMDDGKRKYNDNVQEILDLMSKKIMNKYVSNSEINGSNDSHIKEDSIRLAEFFNKELDELKTPLILHNNSKLVNESMVLNESTVLNESKMLNESKIINDIFTQHEKKSLDNSCSEFHNQTRTNHQFVPSQINGNNAKHGEPSLKIKNKEEMKERKLINVEKVISEWLDDSPEKQLKRDVTDDKGYFPQTQSLTVSSKKINRDSASAAFL